VSIPLSMKIENKNMERLYFAMKFNVLTKHENFKE
jgi:hypothetical protein